MSTPERSTLDRLFGLLNHAIMHEECGDLQVDQLWERYSQWNVLHTFDSAIVDEALRLKAELDAACALVRGLVKP